MRLSFVPVLTDPALVLFFWSVFFWSVFSSLAWTAGRVRGVAPPEIEKPPTQWTVRRRAGMWRA
jgi:hypothetical protein